jgi:hypothetical protein
MMVTRKMIQTVVEESDEHAVQWLASMYGESSVWCCNSIKNIIF